MPALPVKTAASSNSNPASFTLIFSHPGVQFNEVPLHRVKVLCVWSKALAEMQRS